MAPGGRAVLRLSGTGTEDATIRLYLEQYKPYENAASLSVCEVLLPLKRAAVEIAGMQRFIGRTESDVVT